MHLCVPGGGAASQNKLSTGRGVQVPGVPDELEEELDELLDEELLLEEELPLPLQVGREIDESFSV